jgi:hypothetical protein
MRSFVSSRVGRGRPLVAGGGEVIGEILDTV